MGLVYSIIFVANLHNKIHPTSTYTVYTYTHNYYLSPALLLSSWPAKHSTNLLLFVFGSALALAGAVREELKQLELNLPRQLWSILPTDVVR